MWSLGVILYITLCGYMPFSGFHIDEVFHKIKKCQLNFDHPEFQSVSPEAIDLIKNLIVIDPYLRLSAKEALEHPWFRRFGAGPVASFCQELYTSDLVR